MQTYQKLSPDEIGIIKNLYKAKAANANTAFVLACTCMFLGTFFSLLMIWFHLKENSLLVVIFVVSLIGLASLRVGMRRRKNNQRLFNSTLEANRKEVITGHLIKVEIISINRLRYHFTGFSKDVFLGIRPLSNASITELHTLNNINITLHAVSITPDEVLLLKVLYDNPVFKEETTLPLAAGDRKKLMPWAVPEYKVLVLVLLVVSVIIVLPTGFDSEITWITSGIAVVIILCAFIPRIILLTMSRNKILMTTRITEKIHVYVRAGKYSSRQVWYRIDNGLLEGQMRSDLQVGDIMEVSFLQKRNGMRGIMIEATQVKGKYVPLKKN